MITISEQEKGCSGKEAFPTATSAWAFIKFINNNNKWGSNTSPNNVAPYKCKFCNEYHVGHDFGMVKTQRSRKRGKGKGGRKSI